MFGVARRNPLRHKGRIFDLSLHHGILPRVAPAVGGRRTSGPAVYRDSHQPSRNTRVVPPDGRSPAALSTVRVFSHYITVSSPLGGAGGRWSTSFRAFRTNRASGQPP